MKPFTILRAVILTALVLAGQAVPAQSTDPASTDTPETAGVDSSGKKAGETIANLKASLNVMEDGLERKHVSQVEINHIRQQADYVADTALRIRAKEMRRAEEQIQLLEALGRKPKDSDLPEPAELEAERQRLENSISDHQGRVKSANVILARVDALRARLAREELDVLVKVLSQRTETPIAPGLVSAAVEKVPARVNDFTTRLGEWWQNIEFNRKRFGTLMWWLVLLVFVVTVTLPTRNWVLHRYGPDHRDEEPSFTRRFRVMLAVGLGNVVIPVVSVIGVFIVFLKSGTPTQNVHQIAWLLMITLCQLFLVTGLSKAAMSPDYPQWRISHFTNPSAVSLYRGIRMFAYGVVVLNLVGIVVTAPEEFRAFAEVPVMDVTRDPLSAVFSAIVVLVIAASMLYILRNDNWWFTHTDEEGETTRTGPSRFVHLMFTVAKAGLLLSIGGAIIGFVNLGLFLSQRIIWSLLLVALAYLFREFVGAVCKQAAGRGTDTGSLLRDHLGYSRTGAVRLMFWVMLAVDIVLSVTTIILLLLIWGMHINDVQSVVNKLLYGINIGDYTLSLVDIGVALGVFLLLYFGVRLFQGFLSNRVLAQTVPDVGVRDALTTGVGYAGIIIAAFVAISTLGLELSKLAIIFGALSVGIGFGLQHVVNNFVSGLILLMHRPIKAGDWIVVGQHEGYVKKINVVATEIQTFDNAEVIVPNSQLVSSEVLNWTHKSTVARVIISVGVSYDSNPEQVREVLLQCARERDDILNSPSPMVIFRDFGDSALIFELRFFIRQADYMLWTASDLRFDISRAFREAGIEIPFPQRDIHIKKSGDEQVPTGEQGANAGAPRRRGESGDVSDAD